MRIHKPTRPADREKGKKKMFSFKQNHTKINSVFLHSQYPSHLAPC